VHAAEEKVELILLCAIVDPNSSKDHNVNGEGGAFGSSGGTLTFFDTLFVDSSAPGSSAKCRLRGYQ
jgi:hypothetical protein